MNIMQITKMIPVQVVWVFDTEDKRQVKAQTYEIEYSLRTEVQEGQTQKQAFLQQNISFSVINSFLYDQLHQSIIYDMESKALVERAFASHDNNFMILPDMSDACLAMSLHCKMNHIWLVLLINKMKHMFLYRLASQPKETSVFVTFQSPRMLKHWFL